MLVIEGAPKEIWSLLPFGESEAASSKHYSDSSELHSQQQMKQFWFTPEQILDHVESVKGIPTECADGQNRRLRESKRPRSGRLKSSIIARKHC